MQMFNVQKLISFILLFFNLALAYISSYFYLSLLFTCSALLCLTFILPFISSLLCFYKFLILLCLANKDAIC